MHIADSRGYQATNVSRDVASWVLPGLRQPGGRANRAAPLSKRKGADMYLNPNTGPLRDVEETDEGEIIIPQGPLAPKR